MKNLQHIATMKKLILTTLLLLPLMAFSQSISYLWSTGDTTASISPSPLVTTTYYVTVTQYNATYVDSITIVVNQPDATAQNITACDSYTWPVNNQNYATSGVYTDTLTNIANCDSVVTLNLTINNSNTATDVITACNSYTWIDGNTYLSSNNTATHTLQNANGCDSVVTLNLTINNSNTATDVITACNSYTWIDGNTYLSSNNTATHTLQNANGCDSVVTLNLTINNSNTGTDVITACDSYTWIDGNTYTSSNNTATHTLQNVNGCDSVVTLNLTINNSNTATDVITACNSYTWIDGNTYLSSNNTATHTLQNANGCDSVVTLNLTINNSNTATDVITACDSYTWIDGNTYTASNNTATHTLQNVNGCDSVVTLNLTINNSNTGTDVITACDSYTWIDGNTYTASNSTATHTLQNVNGCDSVITLNLTINQSSTGSETVTAVQTYTWPTNNQTYTGSGTYNATLQNTVGCDSVVTLNLTIVPPLVLSTTTNDSVICAGGTVNISVSANPTLNNSTSSFNMKVRSSNAGSSANNQFRLTGAQGQYHVKAIHLASGNVETFMGLSNDQILTFANGPGEYEVQIHPTGSNPFHKIVFGNQWGAGPDAQKILEISQWGDVVWSDMTHAFHGAFYLDVTATDTPDLSNVWSLTCMFQGCRNLVGNYSFNNWDVSNVNSMNYVFKDARKFNQNISNWDVSNVYHMNQMFTYAEAFNQPIGNWDVSNVTSMNTMFSNARTFNQPIGNWDVGNVSDMASMFAYTDSFNQPIGNWDISNVYQISSMFSGAKAFNQPIGNWDVSNITWSGMTGVFYNAPNFNQDLSNWCVTNITSQPSQFSLGSALTTANHPVWGACPPTYPAGTVHCNGSPTAVVEVTNPITGKTWMDRNLGASQAATSSTDTLAYGDLYQWGRRADGHQCRTSPTTSTLSSSDQPAHGSFITSVSTVDWRSPQNSNLWQGVNGVNNPCPSGYRLPTETELNAERLSWSSNDIIGAFGSPLKLTVAGFRSGSDGSLANVMWRGYYWSSAVNSNISRYLDFTGSGALISNRNRVFGYSVRCLKD